MLIFRKGVYAGTFLYKTQMIKISRHTRTKRFGLLFFINLVLFVSVFALVFVGKRFTHELSAGTPEPVPLQTTPHLPKQQEPVPMQTTLPQTIQPEYAPLQTVPSHTIQPEPTPLQTIQLEPTPLQPTPLQNISLKPIQIPSEPSQAVQQTDLQSSPALYAKESELNELILMLVEYIGQQQGKYGLYYINLVTREEFGINDRDEYIAASTTKLPMNMLLYCEIKAGRIDPDGILTYSEEDFEPGTGVIQESDFGTLYTVREAARLSIVHSDNCAMNMIIRILGIDNIRQYMQEIGGTIYYGDSHRSCPYDLAMYAAELYRFYEESPDIAEILIEDLQNTAWNDRINKYLPKETKVSHKIGNYPKVYNDVGIVFASEPYAIAIMSENVEQATAFEVIATISKMIYDYVE